MESYRCTGTHHANILMPASNLSSLWPACIEEHNENNQTAHTSE